jgi:hypothetical protein
MRKHCEIIIKKDEEELTFLVSLPGSRNGHISSSLCHENSLPNAGSPKLYHVIPTYSVSKVKSKCCITCHTNYIKKARPDVFYFLSMGQQPLEGQDLLIIEASRLHSDTPHSLELLWTSDRSVAETSIWQHTTLTKDRHPCPRRDSNSQP